MIQIPRTPTRMARRRPSLMPPPIRKAQRREPKESLSRLKVLSRSLGMEMLTRKSHPKMSLLPKLKRAWVTKLLKVRIRRDNPVPLLIPRSREVVSILRRRVVSQPLLKIRESNNRKVV